MPFFVQRSIFSFSLQAAFNATPLNGESIVFTVCVCKCVCVVPDSRPNHNFVLRSGIAKLFDTNYSHDEIFFFHKRTGLNAKITLRTKILYLCFSDILHIQCLTLSYIVEFRNIWLK